MFCTIVAGDSPAWIVHETEHTVTFMDILPMTPGHCLIVPKRHVVDLLDLDDDTAGHVMAAAAAVSRLLDRTLSPLGLNLLHNTGAAADQSQFHFHAHLIPRYGGDRLLHPWERRFGNPVQIAAVADRIAAGWDDEVRARVESADRPRPATG